MTRNYPYARIRAAAAIAAACALFVASAILLPAAVADSRGTESGPVSVELPAPSGKYQIGTLDMHLVDKSRTDALSKDKQTRELMISIWYPAQHRADAPFTPFFPRRIASFYDQTLGEIGIERGSVDFAGIKSHAQTRAPVAAGLGPRPVVLYSPGGGLPRMMGTTLVEELVSHGFVVVTVDSTGQAPVEFPDETRMPAKGVDLGEAMKERVQDVRFVLDQLTAVAAGNNPALERQALPTGLGSLLDLDHIGMFGHSMGGFATAETMITDDRIDAGANLDGSMSPDYGRASIEGVDRPFLLMGGGDNGSTGQPHHHRATPEWGTFWKASTGWKRDLYLPDAEHMSFTDFQSLIPSIGAQLPLDQAAVSDAIGTIDPAHSLATQRAYLLAFFELHLTGQPQPLFAPDADPSDQGHDDAEFIS